MVLRSSTRSPCQRPEVGHGQALRARKSPRPTTGNAPPIGDLKVMGESGKRAQLRPVPHFFALRGHRRPSRKGLSGERRYRLVQFPRGL